MDNTKQMVRSEKEKSWILNLQGNVENISIRSSGTLLFEPYIHQRATNEKNTVLDREKYEVNRLYKYVGNKWWIKAENFLDSH